MLRAQERIDSYFQSRELFRATAKMSGFTVEAGFQEPLTDGFVRQHESQSSQSFPDENTLTCDIASSCPSTADRLLLVSSGLHGVEGYFGAAAQIDFLRSFAGSINTSIILLHAVNPWGFANDRRFDSQNRDLNRNFLIDEPFSGSPVLFDQLDPLLHPKSLWRFDAFPLRASIWIARYGVLALQRAIATGQYDYPEGLFFGGHQPAPQTAWLATELKKRTTSMKRVVHFDLHTGLGKSASYQFLPDGAFSPDDAAWLTHHFGGSSVPNQRERKDGYVARGGWGRWCQQISHANYLYACVEFGTHRPLKVLKALREENRCHFASLDGRMSIESQRYQKAKQELREAFYPRAEAWQTRSRVLANKILMQAVTALDESTD